MNILTAVSSHEMAVQEILNNEVSVRVFWLALAAFALGLEAFVLAGLLPTIAAALDVSVSAAGQLVTAYALTYAVGAPVLAVAFHTVDRKTTLLVALSLFIAGNLSAVFAPSFSVLLACRIVMALGTALCNPTALSVAIAISPPERRGRAVSAVLSGVTAATILGMPIGTLIGNELSWRAPFVAAASIAAIALVGIQLRMARGLAVSTASLAERVAVMRHTDVLLGLLTTTLWATGGFTLFTYLSVPLREIGYGSLEISLVLFAYGLAGAAGNVLGGRSADRIGTSRTAMFGLASMVLSVGVLSLILKSADWGYVKYLTPLPIMMWGFSAWCFNPANAASISRTVPHLGAIALSLNSSFQNLGFAMGGGLGGIVLAVLGYSDLGWVAGVCAALALAALVVRDWLRRSELNSARTALHQLPQSLERKQC